MGCPSQAFGGEAKLKENYTINNMSYLSRKQAIMQWRQLHLVHMKQEYFPK